MWQQIASITLDTEWAFTTPVSGQWFRVRHSVIPSDDFRRGYIAQASAFAPVELQGIRRMYSKQEYDLYQLIKPEPWEERVIAVREYFPSRSGQSWTVSIEVWQAPEDVIDSFQEVATQIAQLKALIELLL